MMHPKSLSLLLIPAVAAIICASLLVLLRPLLQRYALARPNARSSHKLPTPQGGGIAVILASAVAIIAGELVGSIWSDAVPYVLAGAFLLAVIGMVDDLRPIPVIPRLTLQIAVVIFLFALLPSQARILTVLPMWLGRILTVIGLLWFINLVNFMDGLDWMTVAEMLPLTAALAAFGLWGQTPLNVLYIALALAGALIGFAPFNRPIAGLFLGDVGSLPIGLLTGWSLFELAGRQHLVAALLLPLYYLADATITLLRRIFNGEPFWDAHRSHFYQRATDNGFTVTQVVTRVFVLNILLAAMATASIAANSTAIDASMMGLGTICVGALLFRFSRRATY